MRVVASVEQRRIDGRLDDREVAQLVEHTSNVIASGGVEHARHVVEHEQRRSIEQSSGQHETNPLARAHPAPVAQQLDVEVLEAHTTEPERATGERRGHRQ